jgi:TonB-linked SusC/RagA family outer membrane protein
MTEKKTNYRLPFFRNVLSFSLILLFTLTAFNSFCQALRVSGNVKDAQGNPLADVSVVLKNGRAGTKTDANGNFSISASNGDVIAFSFTGYENQERRVQSSQSPIDVILKATASSLQDVVVVGYGTQKRSDITGSVTSVPKERLSQLPVTNVVQALEGVVAGVNVSQISAVPGTNPSILIRGVNSINASTQPLIVIDGVPFSNLGGSMNDINPNDIASIEILKDASAVAIYGTRGSSGVILITTKRGKTGKPTIRYSAYAGPEFQHKTLTPMDGPSYSQKYVDYSKQMNLVPNNPPVPNQSEYANYTAGQQIDWIKEISQPALIQDHSLSISGGTENVKYFISGDYLNQKGVLKGYQYHRASLRSNLDANLTNWLTVGTSLFFAANNTDGGKANYRLATKMSPYGIEYTANGAYNYYPMFPEIQYTSPLTDLNMDVINRSKNINGSFYAELKPLFAKGLKFRLNGNYSYLPTRYDSYAGANTGNLVGGTAQANNTETTGWLIENILSYERNFGKHHVDVTTLYSAQEKNLFTSGIVAKSFINDLLSFNNIGSAGIQTASSYSARDAMQSQMGRINYSYADKYLLTATARRDGYSAFGAATNKYGTFPSIAVGWNISKEDFMQNVAIVNALKLRVSYGTTGNQAIGVNQTLATQGIINYVYNGATAVGLVSSSMTVNGQLGNTNLNWESTTGTNLGLDFEILKSRISGTIEVYKTTTNDLLLKRNLPAASGYSTIYDNLGKVANKGVEVTLVTRNVQTKNFTWSTNLNFAATRNKIVQLYGDNKDDVGNLWFIGKPLYAVYDYKLIGIWQVGEDASKSDPGAKPGDLKFADIDGDGKITNLDKVYLGTNLPKWTGGMLNTFGYKNLHLSIFIQTNQGSVADNDVLDFSAYGGRVNQPSQVGYWTADNKSNTRPALSYFNTRGYLYPSSRNFTRLKDITLSYSFPSSLCQRLKIGSLSAYLSGRNIYTFTNWVGLDPEVSDKDIPPYNFGSGTYPQVSTYVFGINISL